MPRPHPDRRSLLIALGASSLPAGLVAAPAAPPAAVPHPGTLLTVSGAIAPVPGGKVAFDWAALDAMPQLEVTASTPWSPASLRYAGPRVKDILDRVGARGSKLVAAALNDYRVEIPVDEVRRVDVIVAMRLEGKPMSVRQKGPLFVMYPFDREPSLRDTVHYSRCIWQLQSIDVR